MKQGVSQLITNLNNKQTLKYTTSICNIKHISIATAILLSTSAFAYVPTVGNQMQIIDVPSKPKNEPVINIKQKDHISEIASDSNKTIFIKEYKFVGNKAISTKELQQVVAPYSNKDLTMKQVNDVVSSITKYYREKGYFVARAYVAPKAYSDGILTITIIKGTFGNFKIDNSSLASDFAINNALDNLKGEDITSDAIEKAVLLTDDLAGVDVASADIMPGEKVGESDFLIKTISTPRFDGYITGDNYGSRYTGLYRATVGANANSPLGIGDKLSVMGMVTDGYGLKNGSLTYGAPITGSGLNLSAGYYNTQYSLGNDYSTLNAVGNTSALQATLSYPAIRSKLENLNLSINPQMQLISDKQLGENLQKRAGLAVVGADYSNTVEALSLTNLLKANIGYTFGNLSFKDPNDATLDSQTIRTAGFFNKASASLSLATGLSEQLTLKNSFNAQFALGHKNLDGSQDITIGGAYAVRAYPSTQQSGDSGYIYTAELGYTLPSAAPYSHSAFLFYDVGRSFMTNTQTISGQVIPFNAQILQDAGVGYNCGYKNFFGKFQLAQVVGGVQVAGVPFYTTKALFQVGVVW